MNVFFDTNVILDALQNRIPWGEDSKKLIMAVADEKINGFVTAKELCDIWYLANQIHKGEDNAHKTSQLYISRLTKLFGVLDTSADDIETALSYGYNDYEDAVMIATAERYRMDMLVTRNIRDYNDNYHFCKIILPKELVQMLDN